MSLTMEEIIKGQNKAAYRYAMLSESATAHSANCVYSNDYLHLVRAVIEQIVFSTEDREIIFTQPQFFANLCQYVINSVSTVYSAGSNRDFGKNKRSEAVYDYNKMDQFMLDVNRRTNLHDVIVVLVDWNDSSDMPYVRALDRESTEVIVDPRFPRDILELRYSIVVEDDGAKEMKVVWTAQENYILDGQKKIAPANNPNMVNPFGVIPAAVVRNRQPRSTFWETSGTGYALTEAQVALSVGNMISMWQNLPNVAKVLGAVGVSAPGRIAIGSHRAITFDSITSTSPELKVLDFTVDPKIFLDAAIDRFRLACMQWGLIPAMETATASSGVSLKLSMSELNTSRQQQIPIYRDAEKELFDVISVVNNYYSAEKMSPDFNIDFPAKYSWVEPSEQRAADWQAVQNLTMPVEVFAKKYYPGENPVETLRANASTLRSILGQPQTSITRSLV